MTLLRLLKPSPLIAALVCATLAATPGSAVAATQTATFTVTANVQTACVISATGMAFGIYTSVTPLESTSIITVACSDLTTYNIGLNAGTSTGATVTTRAMVGPGPSLLHYGLFSDSARTVNWGNTVPTDTVAGVGTGAAQTITVYGIVPSGQGPATGVYTDTITATVTF